MKKSDIYEVSIKILGIYLFFTSISLLREILIAFSVMFQSQEFMGSDNDFYVSLLIFSLVDFALVILFASFLTFKTKSIVKFVCKQTDYEETSTLFAERKIIYEIALVIMGLLLIAWSIPEFAFKLRNYLTTNTGMLSPMQNDINFIIIGAIKIVLGILSIIYSNSISTFLMKKNKTTQPE